jgi:hypothetical protein
LPFAQRSTAEVNSRADTISKLANRQLWNPRFVELEAQYNTASGRIVAECYFALTEAYKQRWGLSGRTEGTKVAALTAAAIAVVKPIRPVPQAKKLDDVQWLYVNPSFAIFAAYDGIAHAFYAQDFDERRRLFRSLQQLSLPCIDPIIAEGNATDGKFTTVWQLDPNHPDLAYLDVLVSYFEALKREQEYLLRLGRLGG